jgi:hypothetical protein
MSNDPTKDPNYLFKIRLNGEVGFRILLADKAQVSAGPDSSPDPQGQQYSGVRRRRRPLAGPIAVKSSGFINFYDLGQIKDGEDWVDIDYAVLGVTSETLGTDGAVVFEQPTMDDWNDLKDLIFTVPIANWKTEYRKLEYEDAERYGVDVMDGEIDASGPTIGVGRTDSRYNYSGAELINGDHWIENKGLKIEASDVNLSNFSFMDAGAFYFFGTNTNDYMKVTTSNDPDTTGVTFKLQSNANVYLMPRLVSQSLTNITGGIVHTVIGPYRPYARSFWLNRTDPSLDYPLLSAQEGQVWTFDSTNSADLVAHILAHPLTRGFKADTTMLTEVIEGTYDTAWVELQPEVGGQVTVLPVLGPPTPYGALVGVIEQSGTFYYFWRIDNGPTWGGGGPPTRLITLT